MPLHEIGPLVEHHPIFPQRVNFEIANVVDPNRIKARVWERGSGLTMACGTGACAVAAAARLHEYVDGDVVVELPGGELQVRWPGHGDAVLEGAGRRGLRGGMAGRLGPFGFMLAYSTSTV